MWSTIASILKDNTTKCIIIEGGEPKYVLLTFDEYQRLQKNGRHSIVGENVPADTAERVNHELQEIWELGEEDSEPKPASPRGEKVAAISIEDLPF